MKTEDVGQGSRRNFIPVAGAGLEFRDGAGNARAYTALRLHHLSNGHTKNDNRGVSSVFLTVGVLFR